MTGKAFAAGNGAAWLARVAALGLAVLGCLPSFADLAPPSFRDIRRRLFGSPLSSSPLSSTVGGVSWKYRVEDGQASVCGGGPTTGALAIPSTLGGYPVTSIGMGAFVGCKGLKSVTIPPSVTSIGMGAFVGCKGLMSVTIPPSVTDIGFGAFYKCNGLTTVYVRTGDTERVKMMMDGASANVSKLKFIEQPAQ